MKHNIVHQTCPDCGNPLEYYLQQLHPRSTRTPSWIGTCRTPGCALNSVTLSDDMWGGDMEAYRQMNAKMRKGAA